MKGEKRISMVAKRLADGTFECIVTDHTIAGARVVDTMKASLISMQVGKSTIRMTLTKEKKPETEPKAQADRIEPVLAKRK